jgi:hypothetical protein
MRIIRLKVIQRPYHRQYFLRKLRDAAIQKVFEVVFELFSYLRVGFGGSASIQDRDGIVSEYVRIGIRADLSVMVDEADLIPLAGLNLAHNPGFDIGDEVSGNKRLTTKHRILLNHDIGYSPLTLLWPKSSLWSDEVELAMIRRLKLQTPHRGRHSMTPNSEASTF